MRPWCFPDAWPCSPDARCSVGIFDHACLCVPASSWLCARTVSHGDLTEVEEPVRIGKEAAACNNGVSADSSFFASREGGGIVAPSNCFSCLIGLTVEFESTKSSTSRSMMLELSRCRRDDGIKLPSVVGKMV